MAALKRSGLIWFLLLCLALVNGFMAAPSVAHAAKHDSHHAGTHSNALCSWLCAAGQAIETASVSLESTFRLFDEVLFDCVDQYERSLSSETFLRGPPASSAS
jgi:hypothetical protein